MGSFPEHIDTLSVSQITGQIQNTLERGFGSVWVKGEISNLTKHSSGHWYFSLKDSGAQIASVMFRRQNQAVRFELTHGMEITAHGKISVYPPQGRYQLIVDQLLPAGEGDLHLAFETLKKKLEAEGLFAQSRKQNLPSYPSRIGIVTSPTGAAIRDMINIFGRRFPNAELLLLPVRVQGEGAAKEIASAIETFNRRMDCQVIVVGRGGGSLEDLWAFNEEVVARAIAASSIPIVSAVGHETDTSISDYVADRSAPTPSAAAELIVPDKIDLMHRLAETERSLIKRLFHQVDKYQQQLDGIQRSYALKKPTLMIDKFMQNLDHLMDRSLRSSSDLINTKLSQLDRVEQQVQLLNPLSILKRGYAVVSGNDGKIIRSIEHVNVDDPVNIRLSDGDIETRVDKIKPTE